jgi:spore maturation protein CgeB
MKILFLDSPSFGKLDMIEAFENKGYECRMFSHERLHEYRDPVFDSYFDNIIKEDTYDFVFSINYLPSISAGCDRHDIPYLAFVYDNPLVALYSYTLINPCNRVFLFDKAAYMDFVNEGITTVRYLPLCANTGRLSAMKLSASQKKIFTSDVSFVGSLYNEGHNFLDRMTDLDDFTKGYLDAIMRAQSKVNGYYFLEEMLTPEIIANMKKSLEYNTQPGGTESDAYVYANYFLARKLTSMERQSILSRVSERFDTKLYTHNPTPAMPHIKNMGPIDYYDAMPHVFKNSKINLNITLRSIRSGMPLRAFDIMGAGGFLLTNYQEDFLDFFVPGEDYDYYDGEDDLMEKIEYYLSHDKERADIATNAYEKVRTFHTYENRVDEMLSCI